MKESLQPGIRYEHCFVVPSSKTVPALYVDVISRGRHERFIIDRQRFDAKLVAKATRREP